jgi:uncharacterized membrane protein
MNLQPLINAPLAVQRHDVRAHRSAVLGVFVGGSLIAGAFAFTPGRIIYRMFFGG